MERLPIEQAPQFSEFIYLVFTGVMGFGSVFVVKILTQISQSIAELNVRIAVVIEKITLHEKQLDKHDERLKSIELKI